MAGPTIKLPMDDAPFKRVVDQIKEAKKEQRDLQREMKKSGSDAARLSAQLQQVEAKITNLQRLQGGGAGSSVSGFAPQDFMAGGRRNVSFNPNAPSSRMRNANWNDEHQAARSSVSIAGQINAGTLSRAEAMRGALNRGNMFEYLKQNGLEWMHRRGGMIKGIGEAYESGAMARAGGALAGGVAITNAVLQSVGHYSESARVRESEARMATGMDVTQRGLYESELSQQRNQDKYGGIDAVPFVGSYLSAPAKYIEGRLRGNDAISRQETATRDALARAGLTTDNTEAAQKIWGKRFFADKFGSEIAGSVAYNGNELLKKIGLGSNDAAQGAVDGLSKSIDRYKMLEDAGYRLVSENNMVMADIKFQESSKEISHPKWKNPMDVWFQEDANRNAAVMYSRSQNPMPSLRIGM